MKYWKYLFLLVVSISLTSCADDPEPEPQQASRTVFFYMVADSGLASHFLKNIADMKTGMVGYDGNLIVYYDSPSTLPRLFKVESDGTETPIKTYEAQNSADAAVLRRVLNEVLGSYPADSYGLVLSSHGTSWEPSIYARSPALLRAAAPRELPRWADAGETVLTRAFAVENGTQMEIADLAAALPTGNQLDFILFDACFMSGAEVLYALRNSAKYVIASPVEILNAGFPYTKVIPEMFKEPANLTAVCQAFMTYYRGLSGKSKSAAITLVDVTQMDALAASVKAILDQHGNLAADLSTIQPMEGKYTHTFYDLQDYLHQVAGDDSYYQAFLAQLARTVRYEDHTDKIYSDYGPRDVFNMDRCCGVHTSILQSLSGSYRTAYLQTAWAQALGLQ